MCSYFSLIKNMVLNTFCVWNTFLLVLTPTIQLLVPFRLTNRLPWGESHGVSHLANLGSFLFVEMVMLCSLLEGMVTLATVMVSLSTVTMVVFFGDVVLKAILGIMKLESFKGFCSLQ